jgi:hypothetical protein
MVRQALQRGLCSSFVYGLPSVRLGKLTNVKHCKSPFTGLFSLPIILSSIQQTQGKTMYQITALYCDCEIAYAEGFDKDETMQECQEQIPEMYRADMEGITYIVIESDEEF